MIRDLGAVSNLELTIQEYPLLTDDIKPYLIEKKHHVYLGRLNSKPVAYAFVRFDKGCDESLTAAELVSIGTHKAFRHKGFSTAILARVCKDALAEGISSLQTLVPSYAIDDKEDPWNIEHWLWRNQFKGAGTKRGCFRYGRDYEWYVFERKFDVL